MNQCQPGRDTPLQHYGGGALLFLLIFSQHSFLVQPDPGQVDFLMEVWSDKSSWAVQIHLSFAASALFTKTCFQVSVENVTIQIFLILWLCCVNKWVHPEDSQLQRHITVCLLWLKVSLAVLCYLIFTPLLFSVKIDFLCHYYWP